MDADKFRHFLIASSVPLVRLNEHDIPEATASGCLIDYFGTRLLLTVSHATKKGGKWAIQGKYEPDKGTINYPLGTMNFLAKGSLTGNELEDVDFAYVEVPPTTCAYRQEIEPPDNKVSSEIPVAVHNPTLTEVPNPDEEFGFCGLIQSTIENHFGQTYVGSNLAIYSGLRFLRTDDDYHIFSLPDSHPGHQYFKGCSGAPILSNSGLLVALLSGGCQETNEIWGIATNKQKTPIDILVGNMG